MQQSKKASSEVARMERRAGEEKKEKVEKNTDMACNNYLSAVNPLSYVLKESEGITKVMKTRKTYIPAKKKITVSHKIQMAKENYNEMARINM